MARVSSGASSAKVQIDMSGPFFQARIDQTLRENMRRALEGLAEEGEAAVQSIFPAKTGRGRAGVRGRVKSLSGKQWYLTAVVSATYVYPWANKGARGFSGRSEAEYRGGKLEARVHMFRKTASAMRRSAKILRANLVEGLN